MRDDDRVHLAFGAVRQQSGQCAVAEVHQHPVTVVRQQVSGTGAAWFRPRTAAGQHRQLAHHGGVACRPWHSRAVTLTSAEDVYGYFVDFANQADWRFDVLVREAELVKPSLRKIVGSSG
jgi:hypothetical protein